MRRMERKALATKQAQKQEKPERGWTITWDYKQFKGNSVWIAGRCVAIDTWHALNEAKVDNLKVEPYLDVWECMSDDPDEWRRQFEW